MLDTRAAPIVQNDRGRRKISPLAEPAAFGQAQIDGPNPIIVDTYTTIVVTYRAGSLGIAPGGKVGAAWYWPEDWGVPQMTDATAPNFMSARTPDGVPSQVLHDAREGPPPWRRLLSVLLPDGLAAGQEVVITMGDCSQGSAGWLSQTFSQRAHRFRVLVDQAGDGTWRRLPDLPGVPVVPRPVAEIEVIAPSQAVVGQPIEVLVRAVDAWRNPATGYRGLVEVLATGERGGSDVLTHRFDEADRGVHRFTLTPAPAGALTVTATDGEHGLSARSNPILCAAEMPALRLFWGDLHHQGEEGAGATTIEESFQYARDVGGVHFTTYQANDVYVTEAAWTEIQRVSDAFNDPGRFVTLLGTEWTGTPEVGGDRNVFFLQGDERLRRSSHWGLEDVSDEDTDLCPIPRFYEAYRGTDTMIHLHVGGDPSNLEFHDAQIERALEIHSAHATSEWFLEEALRKGYRMAVTANSDDIMGRPGASGPGRLTNRFVKGGLTGAWMPELTRQHLWETLRNRCCYGTTGARIVLWFEIDGHPMGSEITSSAVPRLVVRAWGTTGLARVDIFRGLDLVSSTSLVDYAEIVPGRLRVVWRGSRHKGTGRIQSLSWDGSVTVEGARITGARGVAFDSPAEGIQEWDERHIRWTSVTAGDEDGIEIDYDGPDDATFTFESPVCSFTFQPRDVRWTLRVVDAGVVGRQVSISAVPAREPASQIELTLLDSNAQPGSNPYWVRVTQTDYEKAWSSPIWVDRPVAPREP